MTTKTNPYRLGFMKIRSVQTLFIAVLTILSVSTVLYLLQKVFIPLVIASLLSMMLTPLLNRMSLLRIPRIIGIVLVMGVLFVLLFVVGRLFYSSLQTFTQVFGVYQKKFSDILNLLWVYLKIPNEYFPEFQWTREMMDRVVQISGTFVSFLTNLGLVFLFLVFMLAEAPLSWRKFRRAFPRRIHLTVGRAIADIARQVTRYLTVKTLLSTATGIIVWITLSIIGQDLAAFWGLLAFLLNFIPNLGSFFIMGATMVLGLAQFYPNWDRIIAVWIFMPGIQIIIGNILDPMLQGDQLDISPLIILISLVFWGWIWGIMGMFLAVPLTVALKIILAHIDSLRAFSVMMGTGRMSRSFRRNWRIRQRAISQSSD